MKSSQRPLPHRGNPVHLGQLLNRGVWKAPWMGPQGEVVLLAVTAKHRLLSDPRVLPLGSDYIVIHDEMWDLLDTLDPPVGIARQRALQAI